MTACKSLVWICILTVWIVHLVFRFYALVYFLKTPDDINTLKCVCGISYVIYNTEFVTCDEIEIVLLAVLIGENSRSRNIRNCRESRATCNLFEAVSSYNVSWGTKLRLLAAQNSFQLFVLSCHCFEVLIFM